MRARPDGTDNAKIATGRVVLVKAYHRPQPFGDPPFPVDDPEVANKVNEGCACSMLP